MKTGVSIDRHQLFVNFHPIFTGWCPNRDRAPVDCIAKRCYSVDALLAIHKGCMDDYPSSKRCPALLTEGGSPAQHGGTPAL